MDGSRPLLLVDSILQTGRGGSEVSVKNLFAPTLKAYLERARPGARVEVETLPLAPDGVAFAPDAARRLLARAPAAIGVFAWVFDGYAAAQLCLELRALAPGVPLFAGGPGAVLRARAWLREGLVDFVACGDWEPAVLALLDAGFAPATPPAGVVDRAWAAGTAPPSYFFLGDLSPLPSPYEAGLLQPTRGSIGVEESRGCAYGCAYCYIPRGMGGAWRPSTLERITGELRWAREHGVEAVALYGTNFDPRQRRCRAIADAAREIFGGRRVLRVLLDAQGHEPEIAAELATMTLRAVKFGVQSLSGRVLRNVDRADDAQRLVAAMRLVADSGAQVSVDVMLGLPGDTLAQFIETVEALLSLGDLVSDLIVNWAMAIPGTPMGDSPARYGIREVSARGAPYIFATDSFPREDMLAAFRYVAERRRQRRVSWVDPEPSTLM